MYIKTWCKFSLLPHDHEFNKLCAIPTFQESQRPTALHLPSSVVRINSGNKSVDVEQLSGEEPERITLAFGSAPDMEAFSQVGSAVLADGKI